MHLSGRTEGELLIIVAYVVIASIQSLPKDKKDFSFYDWFYDTSHMLLNTPMAKRVEQRFDVSQSNGTVSSESKISTTEPAKNA